MNFAPRPILVRLGLSFAVSSACLAAGACGGSSAASDTSTTPSASEPTSPPARVSGTPHPTLTPLEIRAAVGSEYAAIQACYNQALVRNPSHRGSVLVFFEIAPDGHVLRSNILSNSSGDDEAGRCLLSVVQGHAFPPTGHGIVETRYSFDFREVDRDGDGID